MARAKFVAIPSYYMIPNSKGEWISTSNLVFYSHILKRHLIIPKLSVCNLASIPKPLRSLIAVNGPHRPAAAIHDYLYEVRGKLLDGTQLTREQCDIVFNEVMACFRENYFRALPEAYKEFLVASDRAIYFAKKKPLVPTTTRYLMFKGVRIGGKFYW